ncbi:hypothetical protein ZOD2009_21027 [Haladaptatus paucihalophilus DX253]|uniref:Uncharacterized protein n=1 Tax=Haladaptatus paucihalophilus DX253 TaxID=797209 RepID=E7QZJ6_HALPU|nr:hypothetical protein ZOD2009_21027 [Haladaptatus paucihalophilus DX253]
MRLDKMNQQPFIWIFLRCLLCIRDHCFGKNCLEIIIPTILFPNIYYFMEIG